MANIPLGVRGYQDPTLLPNFDPTAMSLRGTLDHVAPADFITEFPRVSASATATIGGTVTAGNTITLTVTSGVISGGSTSVTYTVVSGDTTESIAAELASLLNTNAALVAAGAVATVSSSEVITLSWPGPVGNSAVLSYTLSGGATETVTLSPANGKLTGGSGPIIPLANFTFTYNAATMSFFYGIPRNVGDDLVSVMVTQGMPIA